MQIFAGFFWHCPLSRLILVRPTGFSCFYSAFFPQKEDEGVAGDAEDAGLEADFFLLDRPTGLGGFVFLKYGFAQRVWVFWLSTGLPNGSGG